MRGKTTTPHGIELDQSYRVYDGQQQTDQFTVVGKDGRHALVARSNWDALERIDLEAYLEQYILLPANGVPLEAEQQNNPDRHWQRY